MDSRGKFESRFFGFVQDLAKNKKKYHPSLNKLSYGEIRRIYSALKKVG